jgi:outer membrane protein TolC
VRYGPWLVAVAAVLLASCTVGPNYVRPDTPRTAAYKESPPEAYKNPGVWQPAQPSDDTPRANWWELFGDEQLNAL